MVIIYSFKTWLANCFTGWIHCFLQISFLILLRILLLLVLDDILNSLWQKCFIFNSLRSLAWCGFFITTGIIYVIRRTWSPSWFLDACFNACSRPLNCFCDMVFFVVVLALRQIFLGCDVYIWVQYIIKCAGVWMRGVQIVTIHVCSGWLDCAVHHWLSIPVYVVFCHHGRGAGAYV